MDSYQAFVDHGDSTKLSPSGFYRGSDEWSECDVKNLREVYEEITSREFSWRQRFYHIIHGQPVLSPDDIISYGLTVVIGLCVIASTAAFVVETLPTYYDPSGPSGAFFVLESVFVGIFTLDFVLRVATATSVWNVVNVQGVFDFLSIIGFYLAFILDEVVEGDSTGVATLQVLRILRLARVLRLTKLSRRGVGMTVIWGALKKSEQGLLLLVVLVALAVLLGSSGVYFAETSFDTWDSDRSKWYNDDGTESDFQSVPVTFWFVVQTVTTTGYGDVVPTNEASRMVTAIVMFFAVIFLAFPNMLIGSNFESVHRSWKRQRARKGLGRLFRFVRYAVRFTRMWRHHRKTGNLLARASGYNIATSFMPQSESTFLEERKDVAFRRTTNFFFRPLDFPDIDYTISFAKLNDGHLERVIVQGIPVADMLQRLIEIFSCSATVEELYESYLLFALPSTAIRQHDLAVAACHLANSGIIELFVLNRLEDRMVMHLARKGVEAVAHCGERKCWDCVRSFADSKDVWETTTGTMVPFSLPIDGFRRWQALQESVPARYMGFVRDLKRAEAKSNSVFRDAKVVPKKARQTHAAAPTEGHGSKIHSCAACLHCHIVRTGGKCRDRQAYVDMLLTSLKVVDAMLLKETAPPLALESAVFAVPQVAESFVSPPMEIQLGHAVEADPPGTLPHRTFDDDVSKKRKNSWDDDD